MALTEEALLSFFFTEHVGSCWNVTEQLNAPFVKILKVSNDLQKPWSYNSTIKIPEDLLVWESTPGAFDRMNNYSCRLATLNRFFINGSVPPINSDWFSIVGHQFEIWGWDQFYTWKF